MQSAFSVYLQLGFEHISDLSGYDHILFIIALCAVFSPGQWKRVALLATAFTIGHSITLAMAVFEIIPVNTSWIEFLIPVTIIATALYNVIAFQVEDSSQSISVLRLNYLFASLFGLIHGMGFSNFLRSSLLPGQEHQLGMQLLAFNIGVELGQLAIVAVVLMIAYLAMGPMNIRQKSWNLFISGGAFGLALVMALERVP